MNPRGYIGSGIGCGLLGVIVMALAHGDDDVDASMAQLQVAMGETPDPSGDGTADFIAVLLFLAAIALVLIGLIGTGVKIGRRESAEEVRSE